MAFLRYIIVSLLATVILFAQYDRMGISSRVSCGTYSINNLTFKQGTTLTNIICSSGVCTVSLTSQPHLFIGANVTVRNSATGAMNGTFPVQAVSLPSAFKFIYWNANAPDGTYTDTGMLAYVNQTQFNGTMGNTTVFNTTVGSTIRIPIFTLLLNQKIISAVISNGSAAWNATNLTGATVTLGSANGTDDTVYWKPYPTGTPLAAFNLFTAFNSITSLPNVSKINTASDPVNLVITGTFSTGDWSGITDLNGTVNANVCVENFN